MKILFLLFCIICLESKYIFSQDTLRKTRYQVEAGTYIATSSNMPFWLRANQFGEVPYESNLFSFRGEIEKDYSHNGFEKSPPNKLEYGYKIRGVINAGTSNKFILSEAYFKTKFKSVEFYLGRKKEFFGISDTTLGSGSYIWSGNSLPIPKVQISLPNYIPILKNKFLSIKGNFSHGVMGSADSTQNVFLHQKSLYFKIGKPSWSINVYLGINHQVQWGGKLTNPLIQKSTNKVITEYPSDLKTYWYVVTALSPTGDDKSLVVDNGGRPGNHLGTIDFAIEFSNQFSKWLFYKQSIYDKGDFASLNNISDGLYGVSINRKKATTGVIKVNIEYLNTSNQGGALSSTFTNISYLKGQFDYFNNITYKDGWSYQGNIIGTPFVMPIKYSTYLTNIFSNTVPKLSPNYILNNRVSALIIGVDSKIKSIGLRTRVSYSNNLGNYSYTPIEVKQLSIQQQIILPIKKYFFSANIGYDASGLLNRNFGLILMVKHNL